MSSSSFYSHKSLEFSPQYENPNLSFIYASQASDILCNIKAGNLGSARAVAEGALSSSRLPTRYRNVYTKLHEAIINGVLTVRDPSRVATTEKLARLLIDALNLEEGDEKMEFIVQLDCIVSKAHELRENPNIEKDTAEDTTLFNNLLDVEKEIMQSKDDFEIGMNTAEGSEKRKHMRSSSHA